MRRTDTPKLFFLTCFILFTNTANAYNPDATGEIALWFFLFAGFVVFLFIFGAVNYFRKVPEHEEDLSQDEPQNEAGAKTGVNLKEESQSTFVYVLRKSFLIFVILIIIFILIATLNMDA